MIEIIPNWHPVFVHFTVGLLFVSAVIFFIAILIRKEKLREHLLIVASWNLWLGTIITVGTVLTGLYAFNTIPHQFEAQHLAMLDHRKWALGTAAIFTVLSVWSFIATLYSKAPFPRWANAVFVILLFTAAASLTATGYKGGELVYRHGLGVITQPTAQEDNHHDHQH